MEARIKIGSSDVFCNFCMGIYYQMKCGLTSIKDGNKKIMTLK
ncbi:Uncharacterized protein dnm_021190 [Desulfonema magnum]|uniref:Uncharacterized protein n=1 Tax=Desulfonema magnum TaxID=45655 RepID=A0A975BIJ2_9BACT|nr:Uncharacterized protein dnm_021190 [Desulfonema magnum]